MGRHLLAALACASREKFGLQRQGERKNLLRAIESVPRSSAIRRRYAASANPPDSHGVLTGRIGGSVRQHRAEKDVIGRHARSRSGEAAVWLAAETACSGGESAGQKAANSTANRPAVSRQSVSIRNVVETSIGSGRVRGNKRTAVFLRRTV